MDLSKIAKQLGEKGGKKSAEKRFAGKSKKEISEMMRIVRYSKKELKEIDEMAKDALGAIKRATKK